MMKFIKTYNELKFDELETSSDIIYHYTSPEGLKGIIEDSCLYATDMYFLNDTSEGMYVIGIVERNLEEFCQGNVTLQQYIQKEIKCRKEGKWKELTHDYTISFCMNDDLLEMWNYYTKGNSIQGYNIGFDAARLSDRIQIEIMDQDGNHVTRDDEHHLVLYHGQVIYDENRQKDIIKMIFDKFYQLALQNDNEKFWEEMAYYVIAKVISYGKFFKHPKFEVEQEYRFMYSTTLLSDDEKNLKKGIPYKEFYRIHEGCFIPYQKCLFDRDSIKKVTFSPTLHNEMTEAGLNRMLKLYEIDKNVTVEKSEISLRF